VYQLKHWTRHGGQRPDFKPMDVEESKD